MAIGNDRDVYIFSMNKEHLVVQNCNAGLSSSSQHSFALLLWPQWVQIWSGVVLAYQFSTAVLAEEVSELMVHEGHNGILECPLDNLNTTIGQLSYVWYYNDKLIDEDNDAFELDETRRRLFILNVTKVYDFSRIKCSIGNTTKVHEFMIRVKERLVPRIHLNETSYTICEGRQVDLPLRVENFDGILPDMEVLLNDKSVPMSSWSYNHTGRLFKLLPTSNMSFAGGWSIIVRNERDEAMANLTIETEKCCCILDIELDNHCTTECPNKNGSISSFGEGKRVLFWILIATLFILFLIG
ncbi:uncharacterized protein LOC134177767 [Corticium candelabrum]|uniref:uncharacterized protein LOC134177767 n=1 Tax=Corticium candelabrum TaxID=121492 RepID=UPI002E2738B9|nr:uncharacterized protein LOC134177767 [Corticium candelabrum]